MVDHRLRRLLNIDPQSAQCLFTVEASIVAVTNSSYLRLLKVLLCYYIERNLSCTSAL